MNQFPLPVDVMYDIFEKSRALDREDGRNKMKPTIASFEKLFNFSQNLWLFDFDYDKIEYDVMGKFIHNPMTMVRLINVELNYTIPYRKTLWVKHHIGSQCKMYHSGAFIEYYDEEDEEEDEEEDDVDE
jgi:hypothetical protein